MKAALSSITLMVLLAAPRNECQTKSTKLRLAELPKDEIVMVIVSQPDSPLSLEGVSLLVNLDNGKILKRYRVRNVSGQAVATFTVNSWSTAGSGGTLPVVMANTNRVLQPGETLDSLEDEDYEIVKFGNDVRSHLKRQFNLECTGKIQNVFFLMIDTVGFTDGSQFSDRTLKEKLGLYLSDHYRFPD
jgi:hypothetical protein